MSRARFSAVAQQWHEPGRFQTAKRRLVWGPRTHRPVRGLGEAFLQRVNSTDPGAWVPDKQPDEHATP